MHTSIYDAATSECFSFVRAMNISQNTDHHSKRKPPGASIATRKISSKPCHHKNETKPKRLHCDCSRGVPTGSDETLPSAWNAFAVA